MFKTHNKKYDYSIDLDQQPSFEQHHQSTYSPTPLAATTPIHHPPLFFNEDTPLRPPSNSKQPRARANSMTGLKRNNNPQQEGYGARQEGGKQGRKVYLGAQNNPPALSRHNRENKNTLNTRAEVHHKRTVEPSLHQEYEIEQQVIMEKVSRINRMNEEINSRLQRILNAIDSI